MSAHDRDGRCGTCGGRIVGPGKWRHVDTGEPLCASCLDALATADAMTRDAGGKTATAYLVVGCTGEYSDRSDWYVAALPDKAAADTLLAALEKWAREKGIHSSSRRAELFNYEDRSEIKNPLDPQMHVDYTGVDYFAVAVPLLGRGTP